MAEDYYKILGVTKSSTPDEIKRAYRKMALQYHPDRNKGKEASDKFKEVTKAYEVLSDAQKRQTYDQFGSAAFEQGGPSGQGPFGGGGGPFGGFGQQGGQYGPFSYTYTTNGGGADFDFGGFSDPFEIFEQFFGGESPFGSRARRRPVYSISIDFMEAIKGTEKKVQIDGKPQTIKIPKGVENGNRVRFDDYDIVVEVTKSKEFKRQGADIYSETDISFAKAALGTEMEVKTVLGNVRLKIPSGTQPGTVFRLREKGAPKVRGGGHGDHYVTINVVVPKHLTSEQKKILEQLEGKSSQKHSWF